MDPFRDDTNFAAELRALRPTPRPAFAAELDDRAAAGFPRESSLGDSPLGRLAARLRALPPRRLFLSAGATAVATLAVATAVVAVSEPGHPGAPASSDLFGQASPPEPSSGSRPSATSPPAHPSPSPIPHRVERGGSTQYESALPALSSTGESSGSSGAASGSGSAASGTESSAALETTGPFASKAPHRDVERSAELVLDANPSEVADDAARVFEAVHTYDGIVLSSSVRGGPAGNAGAEFELLIPSGKLGDALAAFSGIAEVRSRHDASDDITAPTVRLGEHLRDSRARIDGLLVQLARADTDAERAEVEAQLQVERRQAASLRSQVTKLSRRAHLSRVSLRIESGDVSTSGGGWGAGDALGDAGHILGIAAGVAIVGLAVLAPLALIALLAWLASRAWVRRNRERALGE